MQAACGQVREEDTWRQTPELTTSGKENMGWCFEATKPSHGALELRETQVVVSGVSVHRQQLESLRLPADV